jgi:hypothetical protein
MARRRDALAAVDAFHRSIAGMSEAVVVQNVGGSIHEPQEETT